MTTDYNKTDGLSPTTRKLTGPQFMADTESAFAQTNIHTANHFFYKHHTDGRRAQHTKGQESQQLQDLTRQHSMQNHTKKTT